MNHERHYPRICVVHYVKPDRDTNKNKKELLSLQLLSITNDCKSDEWQQVPEDALCVSTSRRMKVCSRFGCCLIRVYDISRKVESLSGLFSSRFYIIGHPNR